MFTIINKIKFLAKNRAGANRAVAKDGVGAKNGARGFTLIEVLLYGIGLVLILGAISSLIYYMYDWYRHATILPRVDRVGISIVDRVVRDIRTGVAIDGTQSSFGSNIGSTTIQAQVNEVDIIKAFAVDGNRVTYRENTNAPKYLSPADMNISRFRFTYISTSISDALRLDLDITYDTRDGPQTKTYTGLAILRQSYE